MPKFLKDSKPRKGDGKMVEFHLGGGVNCCVSIGVVEQSRTNMGSRSASGGDKMMYTVSFKELVGYMRLRDGETEDEVKNHRRP